MTVVVTEFRPDPGRRYTFEDLAATPDDGRRYEIVDGLLRVSPSPTRDHQIAVAELTFLLHAACPPHLRVLPGPLDVLLAPATVLVPDVLVLPTGAADPQVTETPLLVVEVRSPGTATFDRTVKKAKYAAAGVPSYWIVDPRRDRPRLVVHELRGGRYHTVADATGDEPVPVAAPFPVTVVPACLVPRWA